MNIEDYKNKIALIEKEAESRKQAVHKQYALENNDVNIGDFVEDSMGLVLVEKIRFSIGFRGIPGCVYFGAEYTKKRLPRKDGSKRGVWQCNLNNKG